MKSKPRIPYIIEFCLIYGDYNRINWDKVIKKYGKEKVEEIQKWNKNFVGS